MKNPKVEKSMVAKQKGMQKALSEFARLNWLENKYKNNDGIGKEGFSTHSCEIHFNMCVYIF